MAKAQFHKNQRVFVKPVSTWAQIEKVLPQWAKGLDEPVRITYDVGLGRPFGADELQAEEVAMTQMENEGEHWRVVRYRNKWQRPEDCGHHPYPGTYPVIVTAEKDWGGWRTPGAEYDLDPERIELQARIMSNALRLLTVSQRLVACAKSAPEKLSNELNSLAHDADEIIKSIQTRQEDAA